MKTIIVFPNDPLYKGVDGYLSAGLNVTHNIDFAVVFPSIAQARYALDDYMHHIYDAKRHVGFLSAKLVAANNHVEYAVEQ